MMIYFLCYIMTFAVFLNCSNFLSDGVCGPGAWPESESFSDEGFGPIPSKWRGICQSDSDPTFHCNR